MRIITKALLALSFTGALALTSCKDYDEDNYNNQVIALQTVSDQLQQQLKEQLGDLETELKELIDAKNSCECDPSMYVEQSVYEAKIADVEDRIAKTEALLESQGNDTIYVVNKDTMYVVNNDTVYMVSKDTVYVEGTTLADTLQTITDNRIAIAAVQGEVATINTTVDSLKSVIPTINTRVDSVASALQNAEYTIEANKVILDSLARVVDSLCNVSPGTIDLSDYYTKVETNELLEQKLQESKDYCDSLVKAQVDILQGNIDNLEAAYKLVDQQLQDSIDALAAQVATITSQLEDMADDIDDIQDALAKQVTGIIVQQVYNPTFGMYNSLLTNVQTNALVACVGKANESGVFPYSGATETYTYRTNGVLVDQSTCATAGTVYLTVNPVDVDFTGLKGATLVNSIGDKCAIELGGLTPSQKVLTSGYTRADAATNGFYEVEATLPVANLTDENLYLTIDTSQVKTALSSLLNTTSLSSARVTLTQIAKCGIDVLGAMSLPAQGVQVAWSDSLGDHAVNSNYNIAAIAVNPLGFNSVDAIFADGGAYWRGYDKALSSLTRISNRLGKAVTNYINRSFDLDELQVTMDDLASQMKPLDDLVLEDIVGDSVVLKQSVDLGTVTIELSGKLPLDGVEIDIASSTAKLDGHTEDGTAVTGTVSIDGQKATITDQYLVLNGAELTITFTEPLEFDVVLSAEDIQSIFGSLATTINGEFANVNSMMNAVVEMCDEVNTIINAIYNLEDAISSGSYLTRIFNYLDKLANAVATYTPTLFKPVLLVNSDSGLGICGVEGAPSAVSGTVTVYPTTYSAGLLAPICKAYIEVNGTGEMVEPNKGYELTNLNSGLNTITYYALDYNGTKYSRKFVVNVK